MGRQKILLYIFWGIITTLLVSGIYLYLDLHKKNSISDNILVKVNEKELSAGELSQALVESLEGYDLVMAKDKQVVDFTKNKIVDEFISDTLLSAWADRNNIVVSSDEIEEEIKKIRSFYPDDLTFKEALSQSRQSYSAWEGKISKKLLQKKVFDYLRQKIEDPSESDLKSYYNSNQDDFKKKQSVRIRQIVVESEDTANRIYGSLNSQSNFAELAKKYSIAPEATRGGDIGWIEQGTLDVFEKAFNMRVGQKSGVIKSPYGFHIYEVLDKRGEHVLTYDSVKEKVKRILISNKEQAIYSAWLEEQIRNSKIFKNQEAINSILVRSQGESK